MGIRKPSVSVAGIVLAIGLVAGITSTGMSQTVLPDAGKQASDAPAKDTAPNMAKSTEHKAHRPVAISGRNVHVDVPTTRVDVQKDTGRVRVNAPYTNVKVDPVRGQVRVRAPYVDLNIRW